MGKLTYDFSQNRRKYFVQRHQFSEKSNQERKNRIIKFLRFCESKQIKKISDIRQKHYDQFLQTMNISDETVRKYAIVIKEFCARAHLDDIRINPTVAKKRKISKKTDSIIQIMKKYVDINDTIIEQIRSEIEKVL